MNRRDFLTRGSLAVAGFAVASGLFSRTAFAVQNPWFSIDVVTAHPNRAIRLIERVIQESAFRHASVQFSEYPLSGRHVGDIAYTRGLELMDYRHATDGISKRLRETARALSLPQQYDNPVLLRFASASQMGTPTEATVFCGDVLVKTLPISDAHQTYHIESAHGHVDVAVLDQSVSIVDASCKHKTCMKMGAIYQPGQNLVCIPNQITIAIGGTNPLGVDSLTF